MKRTSYINSWGAGLGLTAVFLLISAGGLALTVENWWGFWPQIARSSTVTMSLWLYTVFGLIGAYLGATPRREGFADLLAGSARPSGQQWWPIARVGLLAVVLPGFAAAVVIALGSIAQTGTLDTRIISYLTAVAFTALAYLLGVLVGQRLTFIAAVLITPLTIIATQLLLIQFPEYSGIFALSLVNTPSTSYFLEPWLPAVLRLGMSLALLVTAVAAIRAKRLLLNVALCVSIAWTGTLLINGAGRMVPDTYAMSPMCRSLSVDVCTDQAHSAGADVFFDAVSRLLDRTPTDLLTGARIDTNPELTGDPNVLVVALTNDNSTESQFVNESMVVRGYTESLVQFRCRNQESDIDQMLMFRGYVLFGADPNSRIDDHTPTLAEYQSLGGADIATLNAVMALGEADYFRVLLRRQQSAELCRAPLGLLLQ